MSAYRNGMDAQSISGVRWRKSSASNPAGGNCVEFADLPSGEVAVRNSRFPDGPALIFTKSEIAALLTGARRGDFDGLVV